MAFLKFWVLTVQPPQGSSNAESLCSVLEIKTKLDVFYRIYLMYNTSSDVF